MKGLAENRPGVLWFIKESFFLVLLAFSIAFASFLHRHFSTLPNTKAELMLPP